MNKILETATKLLSWDVLKSRGIRDIKVDENTNTVALVGPPLKIETNFIKPQFVHNRDYALNVSFAKHFDIPIKVEHWKNSWSVQGTSPMWFHGSDESGEHLEDFLSNLGNALRDAIRAIGGSVGDEDIRVTLLSEPGYPFTPGVTKEVYSAREKKFIPVGMPPYATEIVNRDGDKVMGVDFCKLLPVVCGSEEKSIVGRLSDGAEILVTHCTKMHGEGIKIRPDYAEIVKRCPGMLFPSMATGLIPACNFGETVLAVSTDVILSSMAPYKKRGAYEVATYGSDVWTETAGAFVAEISELAWKQLHGDVNWYYTSHLYVMGPSIKESGFGGEDVKMITSTKSLRSNIARKFKKWSPDITKEKFQALSDLPSGERYAYLESKLNIILGWDCIPIAVCPEQLADSISKNLGAYGFKGKILAVPLEAEMILAIEGKLPAEKSDFLMYKYAWICRDVILRYAKENNMVMNIQE